MNFISPNNFIQLISAETLMDYYNKYRVAPKEKRTLNGKLYASLKEKRFKQNLELLKNAKNPKECVINIEEQVPFILSMNGILLCKYILDFKVQYADDRVEFIDVKGYKKGSAYQLFKLKKQLMKAIYDIEILEI